MTNGETVALTRRTCVGKVVSLLFNALPGSVLAFLPGGSRLITSWLQSPSAVIWEPKKRRVCHYFHLLPTYLPWSDGTRCHDLGFLNVDFSLSFALIKGLSSSLLSAIRVETSVYLRLLIFLLAALIPACNSSSLAFHIMCSAYKLNKQGDNIQPCHTPFSTLNQPVVPYI